MRRAFACRPPLLCARACRCVDGTPIRKFKTASFPTGMTQCNGSVGCSDGRYGPPVADSALYVVGELDMANMIAKYGAVEGSMHVSGWGSHQFGSAASPNVWTDDATSGGHAFSCYGWGTTAAGKKYWKCLNSYGSHWGAEGRGEFYVERGVGNTLERWGFWAHNLITPDQLGQFPTPSPPPPSPPPGCGNTCNWFNDQECDDGGPGADWASCSLGTDCADCGTRGPTNEPEPEPPSGEYVAARAGAAAAAGAGAGAIKRTEPSTGTGGGSRPAPSFNKLAALSARVAALKVGKNALQPEKA